MAGTVFDEVELSLFVAGTVFGEIGACSDRPRNVNDGSALFSKVLLYFGRSLFVAGAVFDDVGG